MKTRIATTLVALLTLSTLSPLCRADLSPPTKTDRNPSVTRAAQDLTVSRLSPDSYLVYVDPPTGFMFLKTPVGWKFKGQLPAERMASLPGGIYTSLLAPISVTVTPDEHMAARQ